MADPIHYTSWTLGRSFTFREWCDYLDEHSTGETVAEFNGWKYNVHGVCLNKRCDVALRRGKDYVKVLVYQMPAKDGNGLVWMSTIDYAIGTSGGIGPADREGSATVEDTILFTLRYALDQMLKAIDRRKNYEDKNILSRYEGMAALIREEIGNRMQLSLFD